MVQMGTIHQVSREVSSFVILPKMILVWWLSRCFCLFCFPAVDASGRRSLQTPELTYTYISNFLTYTIIPETKALLARWLTRQQQSPPGQIPPCRNTTNTHLSLPERESVSSASDPASRLLQPGCNTEPDNGSTPFIRRTATSSKRNATLSMILGNRKADSTRQPRPRLQLL